MKIISNTIDAWKISSYSSTILHKLPCSLLWEVTSRFSLVLMLSLRKDEVRKCQIKYLLTLPQGRPSCHSRILLCLLLCLSRVSHEPSPSNLHHALEEREMLWSGPNRRIHRQRYPSSLRRFLQQILTDSRFVLREHGVKQHTQN